MCFGQQAVALPTFSDAGSCERCNTQRQMLASGGGAQGSNAQRWAFKLNKHFAAAAL
jgi:hypothetical protein